MELDSQPAESITDLPDKHNTQHLANIKSLMKYLKCEFNECAFNDYYKDTDMILTVGVIRLHINDTFNSW